MLYIQPVAGGYALYVFGVEVAALFEPFVYTPSYVVSSCEKLVSPIYELLLYNFFEERDVVRRLKNENIQSGDAMHINSMISVKDAAALLGCDKKYVRERLDQGIFKGEKRLDGDKEKWFVLRKDIEAELSRLPIVTPKGTYAPKAGTVPLRLESSEKPAPAPRRRRRVVERTATGNIANETTDNTMFFGVDPEPIDASIVEDSLTIVETVLAKAIMAQAVHREERRIVEQLILQDEVTSTVHAGSVDETDFYRGSVEEALLDALRAPASRVVVEEQQGSQSLMSVVQVMAREFAKRIEDYRSVNRSLIAELEEKNRQLRLLPDLKRRADEVYKLEFEAAALKKQIHCMEQQQFNVVVALERAEQETIPQLASRLEEEYRMHSIEVARLREQISDYAARARFNEENVKTIQELESALFDMIDTKAREKRSAQAEIERIKKERIEERKKFYEEAARLKKAKELELENLKKEKEQEIAKLAYLTARFQKEKEFEIALLNDETELITMEKNIALAKLDERLAQIAEQGQLIEKLEEEIRSLSQAKIEETLAAKEESERIAREMEGEIAALNQRLTAMQKQLDVHKTPWWKRWFMPSP